MNDNNQDQPRKYTMKFGDVSVEKGADQLTGEQVYACEKLNVLNNDIARLNASLQDSTILRNFYASVAEPPFKDEIEKEAEVDEVVTEEEAEA